MMIATKQTKQLAAAASVCTLLAFPGPSAARAESSRSKSSKVEVEIADARSGSRLQVSRIQLMLSDPNEDALFDGELDGSIYRVTLQPRRGSEGKLVVFRLERRPAQKQRPVRHLRLRTACRLRADKKTVVGKIVGSAGTTVVSLKVKED
jgi:hypothetical protein